MRIGKLSVTAKVHHHWQPKTIFNMRRNLTKLGFWLEKRKLFGEKKDFVTQISIGISLIFAGVEISFDYNAKIQK